MFPSRASRAFTALLEVADALLAPAPDECREPHAYSDAAAETSNQHPHARRAAVSYARRPAPEPPASTCLTVLVPATPAARRAAQRVAH